MSELLNSKPIDSGHTRDGYYLVYEYDGKLYKIGYGDNGYIKSFYPLGD